MLRISQTVIEAFQARKEASFLEDVGQVLREQGIEETSDHLERLLEIATARGLRSAQDCATFITLEVMLLREPPHNTWASQELSSTQPLSIDEFVAEAQRRCGEHP